MAQVEKRVKLTDTQFEYILKANTKVQEAFKAAQDAQDHLNVVSRLILDSKGLPASLSARLDETSKELVWQEEETAPSA